jgi:thioredoxin reductase
MHYHAMIIGGSFAGLSAALQLARARRNIAVIDAGKPRNRFAAGAHGILGHDGKAPEAIRHEAIHQLALYPTVTFVEGKATHAQPCSEGFSITLASGEILTGDRIILATGLRDELPPIPGLEERWGKTVLHCPYCHGYEVADQKLGVIATSPMSIHQAILLPDWGPTIYFTQGKFDPDPEQQAFLERRGVTLVHSPVVSLLGTAPKLEAVRLESGRTMELSALFVAPKTHLTSPLAEQLGCILEQGPMGPVIQVDAFQKTSIPGVFAAGDCAMPMGNVSFASASGTRAGISAHQSLIFPKPT